MKHGKVLMVYRNEEFSPDTSKELARIEDMLIIKTVLSFLPPSFVPRCKLRIFIKQSYVRICCLRFNFHCWVSCTIFPKIETCEVS